MASYEPVVSNKSDSSANFVVCIIMLLIYSFMVLGVACGNVVTDSLLKILYEFMIGRSVVDSG